MNLYLQYVRFFENQAPDISEKTVSLNKQKLQQQHTVTTLVSSINGWRWGLTDRVATSALRYQSNERHVTVCTTFN